MEQNSVRFMRWDAMILSRATREDFCQKFGERNLTDAIFWQSKMSCQSTTTLPSYITLLLDAYIHTQYN